VSIFGLECMATTFYQVRRYLRISHEFCLCSLHQGDEERHEIPCGKRWIHHRSHYLPCIPEAKIRSVLLEAHDQAGHWAETGTLARLRGLCYWPNQSEDVEKYIAGCLECARHGPATRSQLLNPVRVSFPF